jgi:molecular chaperone GrpE
MSEAENGEAKDDAAPGAGKPEAEDQDVGGEVAFAEPEVVTPSEPDPLDVARAEASKFREQLLRTAADFENYRKRTRREVEDASRKGRETTVKELLPIFDNLERAVQSAEGAPDPKSVADGLRMVIRQFTQTLEKLGIRRLVTVGQPFDPSQHEAIQNVDSSEHPAGVVAAEVQPGYALGDHLLRAAMVVVSKGPPEGAAAPAGDGAEGGADGPGKDPVH